MNLSAQPRKLMQTSKIAALLAIMPLLVAPGPPGGPPEYLKGQLHAHSDGSGDSHTPAGAVLEWYAAQGFDFVVLTDHNHVTPLPAVLGIVAIPGVELTFTVSSCNPPPEPGFNCALHLNGLFVESDWRGGVGLALPESMTRLDIFGQSLQAARELDALVQINHPNYHWSVDAEMIVSLAGEGARFLEIANESGDVNDGGDATHPSAVALWDAALTTGARIYGVATDDAHHYYDAAALLRAGHPAYTGNRGWVMVRAEREAGSIRAAMERGEFYASNGVELVRDEVVGDVWRVEAAEGEHVFRLIGEGGEVLRVVNGVEAELDLTGVAGGYVRVEVHDGAGHTAWTQPIWR